MLEYPTENGRIVNPYNTAERPTNDDQTNHAATSPTNSEAVRCDEWLAVLAKELRTEEKALENKAGSFDGHLRIQCFQFAALVGVIALAVERTVEKTANVRMSDGL